MVISPNALTFGNESVNTTSAPQSATLTNYGATTSMITKLSITGTNIVLNYCAN